MYISVSCPGDVVYYNAPTTSYASDISYETAPQYATYVEAPASYAAPYVTYAAPQPPPSYAAPQPAIYSAPQPVSYPAPIAISVPVQQQQQSSFAFDAAPSIDSYGAPQAPLIGF